LYNCTKNNKIKKEAGKVVADMSKIMFKLQTALKQKGVIVCINTNQFYSKEQDRFIKMYIVKHNNKEVIKTASQIKVINTLNEFWQEVKNNE
jgi:hypothetical protein